MSKEENQRVLLAAQAKLQELAIKALQSGGQIKRFEISIAVHGTKLAKPRVKTEIEV